MGVPGLLYASVNPEYLNSNEGIFDDSFTDNECFGYCMSIFAINGVFFLTFLYAMFDLVALECLSPFYTFRDSTECSKTSFDFDSFQYG